MAKHGNLQAVGGRIRALRQRAKYSQEDFANFCGLARSYYGGVERDERNLAVLNLIRVAKALNVEVGDLFPPIKNLKDT